MTEIWCGLFVTAEAAGRALNLNAGIPPACRRGVGGFARDYLKLWAGAEVRYAFWLMAAAYVVASLGTVVKT